jgi:hypothetical protein
VGWLAVFRLPRLPRSGGIFSLLTQDEQVRCLQAVAAHLAPGGAFVLEAFVPDPTLHPGGQSMRARHLSLDLVRFDMARHDPVAQRVDFQNVLLAADGIRLMARLAGMALRERWGGWRREPYTGSTTGLYVAIYEHAGAAAS